MGALGLSTTRAKTSTSTCAALARSRARAQASSVAPEVSTSSIKTTPPARRFRPAGRQIPGMRPAHCWRAGAATVRPAARSARTRCSTSPRSLTPLCPFDRARQRAGLVVAAVPGPPPMQRHGDQHVGAVEQLAAGARHPAAHGGREVGAVLVFQRMHQRARDLVIAHRGAGALVGRRIGDRLHRQQVGAGIVDEGNAEPRAVGRFDERQLRPAFRADALAVDRLAAGDAERRQRDVEREFRRMPPRRMAGAERMAQDALPIERDGSDVGFHGLRLARPLPSARLPEPP